MSVKATINGEVWEFSTVAEAAEFRRSLIARPMPSTSETVPPARRRGRPPKTSTIRGETSRHRTRATTNGFEGLSEGSRRILEVIRRAPENGLITEEFAQAIGSANPRAVPVRMMVLSKELKALGLKPKDVIQRERIYVKSRARSVFKPGPKLDDALRRNGDLFGGAK